MREKIKRQTTFQVRQKNRNGELVATHHKTRADASRHFHRLRKRGIEAELWKIISTPKEGETQP